jgi:hypothetical protein
MDEISAKQRQAQEKDMFEFMKAPPAVPRFNMDLVLYDFIFFKFKVLNLVTSHKIDGRPLAQRVPRN